MGVPKLKPFDKQLINEYIGNGFNGKLAYLTIRPGVSAKTAEVNSSKLINLPHIQAEIARIQDSDFADAVASREYLIKEAHAIGLEAKADKKLNTALSAVEAKGRLNKVYDKDNVPMEGYTNLIQTLVQVNVNAGNVKESVTINATPD